MILDVHYKTKLVRQPRGSKVEKNFAYVNIEGREVGLNVHNECRRKESKRDGYFMYQNYWYDCHWNGDSKTSVVATKGDKVTWLF